MSAQLTRNITDQLLPNLSPVGSGRTGLPATEQADTLQIHEIVERLERRFSREQISAADLQARVRGFYDQFAKARIRTFIVIFVERLVRRSIEEPFRSPQAL
jgi:hypothetical protein